MGRFDHRRWAMAPSPKLAQIVAALLTDGHVAFQLRNGRPKMSKILLYSNHREECEWFLRLIKQIFGVDGKIVKYMSSTGYSKNPSYKAQLHCSALARALVSIGVPAGDKTMNPYQVPSWIINGSPAIKRSFLRVLFNFDGSVSLRGRRLNNVVINFVANKHKRFEKSARTFFQQLEELLLEFEVRIGKTHIRHFKDDKLTLMLFISNGRSIINFHRQIGFLSQRKNERLETGVSKILIYRRVKDISQILAKAKGKLGSDRQAIERINRATKLKYTKRQFEHMRRNETSVPLDLLRSAYKILGKKMPDPLSFPGSRESR